MRPFLFYPQQRVYLRRYSGSPPSGGGDKRGQGTNGSLSPLDTPDPPLDATPSGRASKCEGPQGRLVLQGFILDRSGAVRSGTPPPCTVWPRTVMRGGLRKVNSGPYSVPKSARRTEPSPRFPRLAAQPKGVAARRRVWGSQEGEREPYGALFPFCPRRGHGGNARPAHRQPLLACGGKPPERRKVSPSAAGKEERTPVPVLGQLLLPSEEENEPHGRRNGDKKDHREPEPRG